MAIFGGAEVGTDSKRKEEEGLGKNDEQTGTGERGLFGRTKLTRGHAAMRHG